MNQMSTVHPDAPRPPLARHGEPLWFDTLNAWTPERGHYLEQTAQVYLRRNATNTRWLIDGSSLDGYGLDGDHDDVQNCECPCERETECEAARDRADKAPLPNAIELLHLLAEALGYEAHKKPETH